jgi:glycosyltransferase involved in cell wall biosynthesis
MKEDERIRLIKNIENRKILYSKSFAALNSKGKYIIELDQDDLFIRDDAFDILYNEAQKDNLDLVHIRDITKHSLVFNDVTRVNIKEGHFIFPKKTHYKKQPELKDKMFIEGNNYLLWGLLIKSDIYKKAIYHLWPLIINYKIVYQEDYTITFMLIILAKKYKYLNHYAFIHLLHSNSASYDFFQNENYFLSILFFGNTLFDYHINKNPKDIGIFIHFYNFFKKSLNKGKKIFPKLYNFLINNVIINAYLSNEQRQFFQKILNRCSKNIKNFEFEALYNYQITNFNKKKRNKLSNPKISIIIFCIENKYLDETINSIQNQNFLHYEIILIYDNKEQNDIDLIQKHSKENPNITIINNKNRKGIVYSISIGVLCSKGKYILILEPSNTLTKQNILNELYNIISDGNTDILEFNLLINNQDIINNNNLIIYKCSHFKSEFNLKLIKYNKNYLNIFLYILQKSKNKFIRTNIFGVIKNINHSNSLKINNIIEDKKQKIKDSIFYINFIFKNSNNSFEDKKFVMNEFFNVMSIIYNKFNSISKESYTLFKNFMKCPYINKTDKKYLNFFYNSLIN